MALVELTAVPPIELTPQSEKIISPLINQLLLLARVPDKTIEQVTELAETNPRLAGILDGIKPETMGLFTALGVVAGGIGAAWLTQRWERGMMMKPQDVDHVTPVVLGTLFGGLLGATVDSILAR